MNKQKTTAIKIILFCVLMIAIMPVAIIILNRLFQLSSAEEPLLNNVFGICGFVFGIIGLIQFGYLMES